jgi:hypothetical protein
LRASAIVAGLALGCRGNHVESENANEDTMQVVQRMTAVQNAKIEFSTFRPPGSTRAVIGRRVKVTAPPALVTMSQTDDLTILDELVPLLSIRERAWAAEVMLAAMTGHEADLVGNYGGEPNAWIDTIGATARDRWSRWLAEHRAALTWDAESGSYVEK